MNYLVDTNVISELRKGDRCDPNVARWYEKVAGESLYLSVLVLGEIRKGVERIRVRDAAQSRALEKWLFAVAGEFQERVLPVSINIADEWGRMNAVRPLPVIDGLLAATAKVHTMTFVTRNTLGLTDLDVGLLNPFRSELN